MYSARTPAGRSMLVTLLASIGAFSATSDITAQTRSLMWTETTQVQAPGGLGTLLSFTGATQPRQSSNALHLRGRTLIQESDESTVVMDLENRRWLVADHENRTVMTFTFDELGEITRENMAAARDAAATSQAEIEAQRDELERSLEEAQANLTITVSSESTGATRGFGSGITGSQHFLVTQFETSTVPEGVDQPEGGEMYFLTELWQTSDVPAVETIYEAWAAEVANDPQFRAMSEDMVASMSEAEAGVAPMLGMWNPQVAAGMQQMAEAIAALDGTTIQSTVTIALVPLGMQVDRDALLSWTPESTGAQIRQAAAEGAREAAADAARGAVRGLFGGFGRGNRDEPPPEPDPADDELTVQPFLRITTTKENLSYRESNDDPLAALEARIAGYAEMEMPR